VLATSTDPTRRVRGLLDDVAVRVASSGTRTERRVLHAMSDVAAPVAPGAAAALVDWGGTEVSRLRAFGVVHRLVVEELGPYFHAMLLDRVSGGGHADDVLVA
jgi:hypothetical protein